MVCHRKSKIPVITLQRLFFSLSYFHEIRMMSYPLYFFFYYFRNEKNKYTDVSLHIFAYENNSEQMLQLIFSENFPMKIENFLNDLPEAIKKTYVCIKCAIWIEKKNPSKNLSFTWRKEKHTNNNSRLKKYVWKIARITSSCYCITVSHTHTDNMIN